MKLICPDCGKQYESGKFCLECGAKLQEVAPELVCPSCGYKAKAGKFCPECGAKLTEQSAIPLAEVNKVPEERKFNEKDERFAKFYDKKGFPRTIPQEERAIAIEELSTFVDQNVAEAKMLLGFILAKNISDYDSVVKVANLLIDAEKAGDKLAYYGLAMAYYEGWGEIIGQNHNEAEKRMLECYQEFDNADYAAGLAELYTLSSEKCDYKKAFEYATIAAEEDEKGGYIVLGSLYLNGWGVKKNEELALENYKMAAALGDETAMNQIGLIFLEGEQVKNDHEQAFYWFNESAKKGSDVGMFNLAYCYKNGLGVKQDEEVAAEWYKKAAELDYADAMYELGNYYQTVLFDLDKSKAWFQKAADLGHADAIQELQEMERNANIDVEEKSVVTKTVSADEWYVPDGTTVLDNTILPDQSNKWRESIKVVFLPKTITSIDLILEDDDCVGDLYIFPNLEKVVIPTGEMDRFSEMSFYIDNQWCNVWYDNGSHICPEILPLTNNLQSLFEPTLYSERKITSTSCHFGILIISPKCEEISKGAFKKQKNLDKVYMFDNVRVISKEAFLECVNMTEIRLSNNIKVISKWMLQNCISLKHLVIPEGVSIIEEGAFYGCRSLETITLPSTISRIDNGGMLGINPFSLCDSLKKIIVPKGMLKYFQGLLGSRAKYVVEV